MSTMFKYRVHEVAKDFKVPTKAITEILTEYATTPKTICRFCRLTSSI
jgi:translation initiation factor IF-2